MLIAGVILALCIALARLIHRRDVRKTREEREKGQAVAAEEVCVQERPLKAGGGFRLVFKSRYLLLIALMIGLYNFVNATGEFIISDIIAKRSAQPAVAPAGARAAGDVEAVRAVPTEERDGSPSEGPSQETAPTTDSKIVHTAFMNYQLLSNLIALLIQLFLVSRIFKWIGVGGALLFLPLIALGGYALISFGAVLALVQGVKAAENGTDYSLQNTTKAALFLVTQREEKYKAKAAIDTFFVRGGDALASLAVFIGTTYLALAIEKYAVINVVMVGFWLVLCVLIIREYRKLKAAPGRTTETG
jgi:AAA family ATP:ADP antiporter